MLGPKPLLLLMILGTSAAWLASRGEAPLALALLAAVLIPWVLYDIWRIQQLRWWLALPSKRDLPTAPGAWGAIYSRLNIIAQRSDSELK
ncbi:MAG: Phosphate regulon sensor protein PhoR, partial [Pseudomonadota bacterium]